MINFKKLKIRIQNLATIKYIIISTAILLFFVYLNSGRIGYLDMRFSYNPEKAYQIISDLGNLGRQSYISFLILDFGIIIFLAITQLLIIVCLLKKLAMKSKCTFLYLSPLIRGIFDILENFSIIIILLNYPKRIFGIAMTASMMTKLKWISMIITMAVIIILTVMLIWKNVKNQRAYC